MEYSDPMKGLDKKDMPCHPWISKYGQPSRKRECLHDDYRPGKIGRGWSWTL